MKSEAVREWEREVEAETVEQMKGGLTPWLASMRAVEVVSKRRQQRAERGDHGDVR